MESLMEDFVDYETALKMKDLGFNEFCCGYYHTNSTDYEGDDTFEYLGSFDFENSGHFYRVGAATLEQAHKWIREKKGLCIVVEPYSFSKGCYWRYTVGGFGWRSGTKEYYKTYEEAMLAGIKHGLEYIKEEQE